ncbi:MAG: UvrD-helicase domain-containing protein [Anaerolineales bacterium]|nr:UvrD-helicase domain-containing protein [Anaerolineales bacterium]
MDLLADLNPQQQQAVTAPPGPTLVLAGPGSGKTRVLTQRIAYLINHLGVAPYRILAVTFTNKAAHEMKARVQRSLGEDLRGLTIGTFHAICARWLRREAQLLPVTNDYVIFDTSDQEALVKQVIQEMNLDEKKFRPGAQLAKISAAKNELIGPDEYPAGTYAAEITKRLYQRYQALLIANNALDFDDLLIYVVRLFREHPEVLAKYQRAFDHVLVDEFQDTNTVQYALLRELTTAKRNLYAVGDPDQSVYRWRGADYRNVRKFQEDYRDHQLILLEQNYRSTQLILDAAMAVIDKHPGRTRKQLFTERQGGVRLTVHEAYDERDEARFVVDTIFELVDQGAYKRGDFAVMYRTNAQSRAVEEAFIHARLPYKLVGAQRFYGRKEVKDLLAYLRLVHNPADSVSLLRVLNTPPRGIGAKTLELLQETARAANLTPAEVIRDLGESGPKSLFAPKFGAKAAAALANFGLMFQHWTSARGELTVLQLFDTIVERISYRGYLIDGTEDGEERWENVLELRGTAAGRPDQSLAEFLQDVALMSDQDTLAGEEGKGVILLTLHAAKGLEFPVVFILGLDEGVLPHQRSFDDPEAMHEERRLMYVGMTRAKDRLYLLRAFRRSTYGDSSVSDASRFLNDIPDGLLAGQKPSKGQRAQASYRQMTSWEPPAQAPSRGRAVNLSGDPRGAGPRTPEPNRPAPRPEPTNRTGQRLSHASYGEGVVIDSKGAGADEEVTVAFAGMGVKRLLASLANLQLLKG